jgi:hypothetical protein
VESTAEWIVLHNGAKRGVVKQWIVYSDKTDAYISDISMETSQLIGRESPATVADRL